jgi:hypothetical protein
MVVIPGKDVVETLVIAPRESTCILFCGPKSKGRNMPKGREKDRELRRKHRKNQDRMKALEKTQRQSGKKK